MKILIDTQWINFIQDLPQEKQSELLLAIMDYPNRECKLNCWIKIIQPTLEKGKIGYFNRIKNLKQNNTDTVSDTVSDTKPKRTDNGDKDKDKDINNKTIIKEKENIKEKEVFSYLEKEKEKSNIYNHFERWIEYKKSIGYKYKAVGLKACYENLKKMSGNLGWKADCIVSYSISNQWKGLFMPDNKIFDLYKPYNARL